MAINNIDKPMEPTDLTQAMGEPDIEIEIEDPEKVTVGIGGMEIEIDPDAESSDDFNANLAEDMDEANCKKYQKTYWVTLKKI